MWQEASGRVPLQNLPQLDFNSFPKPWPESASGRKAWKAKAQFHGTRLLAGLAGRNQDEPVSPYIISMKILTLTSPFFLQSYPPTPIT